MFQSKQGGDKALPSSDKDTNEFALVFDEADIDWSNPKDARSNFADVQELSLADKERLTKKSRTCNQAGMALQALVTGGEAAHAEDTERLWMEALQQVSDEDDAKPPHNPGLLASENRAESGTKSAPIRAESGANRVFRTGGGLNQGVPDYVGAYEDREHLEHEAEGATILVDTARMARGGEVWGAFTAGGLTARLFGKSGPPVHQPATAGCADVPRAGKGGLRGSPPPANTRPRGLYGAHLG
jgi:hypothetical protein